MTEKEMNERPAQDAKRPIVERLVSQQLPQNWDDDYRETWQKLQDTQERLRASRVARKTLKDTVDKADNVINKLYESGCLDLDMEKVVQDYLAG